MEYSWSTLGLMVRSKHPEDVADALRRVFPSGTIVRGSVTKEAIESSRATLVTNAENGWCAVMMRDAESPHLAIALSTELDGEVLGFESHDDCPEIVWAIRGNLRRHRFEGDGYASEGEPHPDEPGELELSYDSVIAFVERITRPFSVKIGDPVVFFERRLVLPKRPAFAGP